MLETLTQSIGVSTLGRNRFPVAILAAALSFGANTVVADGHMAVASADLKNLAGTSIGSATVSQTSHGVLVHVRVADLPPGPKGIHLHSRAECDPETAFKSSLGHHGEGEGQHGLLNPSGPGLGDLGNIYVGGDGIGEMMFFKNEVFLGLGAMPLLDDDGTAIVIHANEDDQISQPIGGAGARIACGVILTS
jgi:Cu-Zn family superoxide dismutase